MSSLSAQPSRGTSDPSDGVMQDDMAASRDDVIAIEAHLQQHHRRHRVTKSRMQSLSRELVNAANDKQVVGDDFFVDPDADEQRNARRMRVHLSIAGVQGRATKTIKRFTGRRGSKMPTQTSIGNAKEDLAAFGHDETVQQTSDETQTASRVYGFMPMVTESPTGSSDSLSSATTSLASTSATPATPSDGQTSWLGPSSSQFESLSRAPTLPTLAEQPSPLLRQSLTRPPDHDVPSRTLTLDEGPEGSTKQASRLSKLKPSQLNKSLARRRHRLARRDTQMTEADEDTLEKVLFDAGIVRQEQERVVTDVLYEHQRGLVLFGLPQFSSAALFQVDPSPWTDHRLKNSPLSRHDFSLPTPFWHWVDREWMVDMSGDVDEQGWTYAVRFRSKYWRGLPDTWRSFVRRRRWIRRRIYVPVPVLQAHPTPLQSTVDWNQDFGEPTSLLSACAALPLSTADKDKTYRWEQEDDIDAKSPFLQRSFVSKQASLARAASSDSDPETVQRWRRAVVEINFHRASYLLRECRLDREKIALWRWWLGLGPPSGETNEADGSQATEMAPQDSKKSSKVRQASVQLPHSKPHPTVDVKEWTSEDERPVADDVWDLLEGKLYEILGLFEFQISRIHLLHLVLTRHPVAHKHIGATSSPLTTDSVDRTRKSSRQLSEELQQGKIEFFIDVRMLMGVYEGEFSDELEDVKRREMGQIAVTAKAAKGKRGENGKAQTKR
ncbi:hypothetical protein ACM66B_002685 [Microbotryomycetes sp. NB124-2]